MASQPTAETKMTREIKAILFDWDLTLGEVLGDVPFEERLSRLFAMEGLIHGPHEIKDAISARSQRIKDGSLTGNIEPQAKEDLIIFYQQILSLLGHKHPTRELAEQLRESYATLPFVLYDDTLPTLQALFKMDMQLGIITNHSPKVESTILSLVGQFIPKERITISDVVGKYKPDREIFKIGAERVRTAPSACMYIGDNLTTDVVAALDNGGFAKALWFNPNGKVASVRLPQGAVEISNIATVMNEI